MDIYDEFQQRMDTSVTLIYSPDLAQGSKILGRAVWKGKSCYLHFHGIGITKGTVRGGCRGRVDEASVRKAAAEMVKMVSARTVKDWEYWSQDRILLVNRLAQILAADDHRSFNRRIFEMGLETLLAL